MVVMFSFEYTLCSVHAALSELRFMGASKNTSIALKLIQFVLTKLGTSLYFVVEQTIYEVANLCTKL